MQHILREIKDRLPDIPLRLNEPMSAHTTFKTGGTVTAMLLPQSEDALLRTLDALRALDVAPLVIGHGSNLLVDDKPLDIVVVKTTEIADIRKTGDTTVRASCGAMLSRTAAFACDNNLSGLEFAHGIPGTVGGGVFMNAGAYGGEMAQVVTSVTSVAEDGAVVTLSREECGFAYRRSVFTTNGNIIIAAEFALSVGDGDAIADKMRDLAGRRRESQPLEHPSAGSTFKRPANGYAAAMIEEAGLKGYRIGGAEVSRKHAGFIVNVGGAAFDDVLRLIEHVQNVVAQRTGVTLEPEVRIIRG